MIGCIPRSPSPAIEVLDEKNCSQNSGKANAAAGNALREVQQLRVSLLLCCLTSPDTNLVQTRLAVLERATNPKSEAAMVVKRERDEDENAGPRQRPRRSVKIETVDLTDD